MTDRPPAGHRPIRKPPILPRPPAPPASATPCSGFPDDCPNPVDVPARSPYHGGGIRCGCGDTKEA